MSILNIQETPRSREAVISAMISDQMVAREWLVTVDDPYDNRFTITADPLWAESDIPSFLAAHPDNLFYTCRNVRLEPASPLHWYARAEYSTAPISQEEKEKDEQPNPLLRLTKFSVDTVEFERYADKDVNDKAYVNSAGEPYPPQVHEDSRPIVRLRKNVAFWQTSWFQLNNTVNESQVTITDQYSSITIPAETGLLKRLQLGELQSENDFQFYSLTCEIHVKDDDDKWVTKLRDQGFYYSDSGNSNKLTRIQVLDSSGQATDCSVEQPLDGSGAPLYGTPSVFDVNQDYEYHYNDFEKSEKMDWTALPFFDGE